MKLKGFFKLFIFAVSIQHSLMLEASNPKFHFSGLLFAARNNGATSEQLSAQLNEIIPLDLRDNMTIVLGNSSAWNYLTTKNDYNIGNGDNYMNFCKRLNQQGIKFTFDIAFPDFPVWPENFNIPNYDNAGKRIDRFSFSVTQIDSVFKNCSNCVGVKTGEVFWGYDNAKQEWLLSVLRVCKKYNKKAYISEGVWLDSHWMKYFYQNFKELYDDGLGAYLVPEFKNTKPAAAYFTMSTLLGAWLTNEVGEIGMYNDHWVWCYQSFGNANEYPAYRKADGNQALCPYIYFLRQWILGAAMGCNSFAMETPNFDRNGVNYSNTTRYLFPFMRGLIQHNIVPSKEKVIEKSKAIINPFGNYPNGKIYNPSELFITYLDEYPGWQRPGSSSSWIDPFGVLYRNSLGISDEKAYQDTIAARAYYSGVKSKVMDYLIRENIPNESKYYFLPILPHPNATFDAKLTKVDLKDYRTNQDVKSKLDAIFTDKPTKGSAWQMEIDNSFFVLNTHENTDIDESFDINLGGALIKSMNGIIPFQNILFGKREGNDNYWFQTNGYVGDGVSGFQTYKSVFKPTTVSFVCAKEPVVTVESNKSRFVTKIWNEQTKILTLICNHTQAGAINFRIQSDTISGIQIQKNNDVSMSIFPNPCKNDVLLKYQFKNSGKFSVTFYDMIGKKILEPIINEAHSNGEKQYSVDFSNLKQGQYICKTTFSDKSSIQKIITKL
jgi:hypothetical protein